MTEFEKEMLRLLGEISSKLGNFQGGTVSAPLSNLTFYAWLEEWFQTYKVPNLKDRGYDMGNTINKHVKANIDNLPLSKVSAIEITKALNKVESERMRQSAYSIYNQALNKAEELKLIHENPMAAVDSIDHDCENGRALTKDETDEFLFRAAKDKEMFWLFKFYLLSGARPSEPLSIRWEFVKENTLRINGTKTKLSDRELPLFPELKELLKKQPKTDERIFPFTYGTVRKHFEKVREQLPFQLTLKDLRHTFGTRCLESGVNMKTVQKWLGHSDYKTTERIYTHITSDFEKEEILRFSKGLKKLVKKPRF